ncbi:MAG: hypothetical protein AB1668_01675 [Nanoarchaeota archaeon]
MNIGDLVRNVAFGLVMASGACGDTHNYYDSEGGSSPGYNEPGRKTCEKWISCCNQLSDEKTRVLCFVEAGGNANSTIDDCMAKFKANYSNEKVLKCIDETFYCHTTPYFELG